MIRDSQKQALSFTKNGPPALKLVGLFSISSPETSRSILGVRK